jgi:CDP-glycerol glycerophosphotransferase (TagB/SpsB family)
MPKDIILFESYPDYSGSSLAVYNELIQRGYADKYDLVWAVDKNVKQPSSYKIMRFFGESTAKQHELMKPVKLIIDSNRYIHKTASSKRVHVRHGCCLKRSIYYCSQIGDVDAIITTSEDMRDCDQRIWPPYLRDKFIITGMPATDYLFTPKSLYGCGLIKYLTGTDNVFDKIIGWLPTYRQHRFSPNTGSKYIHPFGLPLIKRKSDFQRLNDILASHNILILVQPHHAQAKNYTQLPNLSNIKFINESIKQIHGLVTTDLLGNFDSLITDYSAAYHEYIILNRPIALTVDDLVPYSDGCGFFVNYLEWIKGDYILNIDKLCNWIHAVADNQDLSKDIRTAALHKIHKYVDDQSTNRVVDYIIQRGWL